MSRVNDALQRSNPEFYARVRDRLVKREVVMAEELDRPVGSPVNKNEPGDGKTVSIEAFRAADEIYTGRVSDPAEIAEIIDAAIAKRFQKLKEENKRLRDALARTLCYKCRTLIGYQVQGCSECRDARISLAQEPPR